ncbi:hypothetical protein BDN72DRAFT_448936 [Pluteus cervinus]|uniref:Uncharacterized protein n=1 Tax=Pluteus cervinus TaxID=181527 RepID=A0ACD3BC34_9AGAR|nr:hypothetical protein BDN72DRAFT_448936 [Pluteus cervinus]
MLLLSWLAPGGGRGIVALDLLNCTNVQSTPSPTHPSARDDVGTVAARRQSNERSGQPLMDMLAPFHMLYADGVERMAAESLLERQKWVNRIWEAVNRPVALPESSVTRSPTGSIRTILSIDSRTSRTSGISNASGSRSTVFVPPLSSLDDISDFQSNVTRSPNLSRRTSLVSSHHGRVVDDTVIRDQEYVYPGDPRVIAPSRGHSLRRSGSMTDLDDEFAASKRKSRRGKGKGRAVSPNSSGRSLGREDYAAPHAQDSQRSSLNLSGSGTFVTAPGTRTSGASSNARASFYSNSGSGSGQHSQSFTSTGGLLTSGGLQTDDTLLGLSSGSGTEVVTSTLSFRGTNSVSYLGDSHDSSITPTASSLRPPLARTREVRRRTGTSPRGYSSSSPSDSSESRTAGLSFTSGGFTPEGGSYTTHSRSLADSGSYTPTSGSYSRSSGDYTPSHGSSGHSNGDYSRSSGHHTRSSDFTRSSGDYSASSPGSRGSYIANGSFTASNGYTSDTRRTYTSSGDYSSGFTPSQEITSSDNYTPTGSFRGSGSETGYDICQSSDLSELVPPVYTTDTLTAPTISVPPSAASDRASDIGVMKPAEISPVSTEYMSVKTPSSVASFKSLPTIPSESEYGSVDSGSTHYRTSSEKATEVGTKVPTEIGTEYITAGVYTSSESGIGETEPESEYLPEQVSPEVCPSIPSEQGSPLIEPSEVDEDEPEAEVASLAPSVVDAPTPSTVPSIRSRSPMTSLTEDSLPVPPPPATDSSLSTTPSPLSPTPHSTPSAPTPSSVSRRLPRSPIASTTSSSIPQLVDSSSSSSTSDLTPTTLTVSSESLRYQPQPAAYPPQSFTQSSITSLGGFSYTPISDSSSGSLPPLRPSWAEETNGSIETSLFDPSPSMASLALGDPPDNSFETSRYRPSVSVASSRDRMDDIIEIPTPVTSAPATIPLPPFTPVMAPRYVQQPAPVMAPRYVQQPAPVMSRPEPPLPPLPRPISVAAPRALPPPPRLPVPSQHLSVSSPTSSSFSSTTSSDLMRSLSSASRISQVSLNSSLLSPDDASVDIPFEDPSTEPSLLSTPRGSIARPVSRTSTSGSASLPPLPIPPPSDGISRPSTKIITPSASFLVSSGTAPASSLSTRPSLRTEESVSIAPERNLFDDFDRLVDEVRDYDLARGAEHQDLAQKIDDMGDHIRGITDLLQRPPPQIPVQLVPQMAERPATVPSDRVDRSVGGSDIGLPVQEPGHPSPVIPISHLAPPPSTLTRSLSGSSIGSFLSSHNSDASLEESSIFQPDSPMSWEQEGLTMSGSTVTSSSYSSSSSSSPPTSPGETLLTPTSPSALSQVTVRPADPLPDFLGPLRGIDGKLEALEQGQNLTNELLDKLHQQPPHVDNSELQHKLDNIENLLGNLLDENRRGPKTIVYQQPQLPPETRFSDTASSIGTDDSLARLRSILHDIDGQGMTQMPIPVTATSGPTFAQQLDEILAMEATVPPINIAAPPALVRFQYQPPPRPSGSPSPSSVTSLRPSTVPIPVLRPVRRRSQRGQRDSRAQQGPTKKPVPTSGPTMGPTTATYDAPGVAIPDSTSVPAPGPEVPADILPPGPMSIGTKDQPPFVTQDPPKDHSHHAPRPNLPPVRPIEFPEVEEDDRPASAPPEHGSQSWYRPMPEPQPQVVHEPSGRAHKPRRPDHRTSAPREESAAGREQQTRPSGPSYLPMPTVVQLPPLFDSLMGILSENRIAQLATVEQQRELMDYMRRLNDWLGRDVSLRYTEIQQVTRAVNDLGDRVQSLSRDLDISTRSPSMIDGSSTSGSSGPPYPPQQPYPPQYPHPQTFVGGFIPQPPQFPQPTEGVVPNVIPETHPTPQQLGFRPVVPAFGHGHPPPVPTDGYQPGPQPHFPNTPVVPHESPFVPPDESEDHDLGPPLPRPPILIQSSQTPSSSTYSTDPRSGHGPRSHASEASLSTGSSGSSITDDSEIDQAPILIAPTPPPGSSSQLPLTAGDLGQHPFHQIPAQATAPQPQQPLMLVSPPTAQQQPASTVIITHPPQAGVMPMAQSGYPPPGTTTGPNVINTRHSPSPTQRSSSERDSLSRPAATSILVPTTEYSSRPSGSQSTSSTGSRSRTSSSSSERDSRPSTRISSRQDPPSQSTQHLPGVTIVTDPRRPSTHHSSGSAHSSRPPRQSSSPRPDHPGATTILVQTPGQVGAAPIDMRPTPTTSSTSPPVILAGGSPLADTQHTLPGPSQYPPQSVPNVIIPHTPDLGQPTPFPRPGPYTHHPSYYSGTRPPSPSYSRPYGDPRHYDRPRRPRSSYSYDSYSSPSPPPRHRPRRRRSYSYSTDGSSTPRGSRSLSPYSSSDRDAPSGRSRPESRPHSGRGRGTQRPRPGTGHDPRYRPSQRPASPSYDRNTPHGRPHHSTERISPHSSDERDAPQGYRPGPPQDSLENDSSILSPRPHTQQPGTHPSTLVGPPHHPQPLTSGPPHPTHPQPGSTPSAFSFHEGPEPSEISNVSEGRRTPPHTPHSVQSIPGPHPGPPHSVQPTPGPRPGPHPYTSRPPRSSHSSRPTTPHRGRTPSRSSSRSTTRSSLTESDVDSTGRPLSRRPPPRRPSSRGPSPRRPSYTPPRRTTPLDLTLAEQQDQFRRLHEQLEEMHEEIRAAEERRESDHRRAEEHQEQFLLDWEERTAQLIESLRSRPEEPEHRIDTQVAPVADAPTHDAASIASIRSAAVQAASQHAEDLREIVELEREELRRQHEADAEERQRIMEERDAARVEEAEAKEARIRDLEDELARLKGELEEEKARRLSDEEQTRETEREEAQAYANATREQLDNITTLIHQQRDACDEKKQMLEKMSQDKEARRGKKEENEAVLMDMAAMMKFMYDEMQTKAAVREERNMSGKPDLQATVEHLTELVGQQQEVLNQLAGAWRDDCQKHHQDTLDAIKDTAHEQVPFNVQGYLDEFSKALAVEVRMLLAEVGKMREERRVLQHELGELLRLRSKYGPGGEFNENWQPPAPPPAPPSEGPPEPPMPDIRQAPPAWRSVMRGRKKKKDQQQHAPAQQMPQAPAGSQQHPGMYMPRRSLGMDPRDQVQSWQPWHPDPANVPSPLSEQPAVQPRMLHSTPESPNNPFGHSPRNSYGR